MATLYSQSTQNSSSNFNDGTVANANYAWAFIPTATGIPAQITLYTAGVVGTATGEIYIKDDKTFAANTFGSATGITFSSGTNVITLTGGSSITSGNTYWIYFRRTTANTAYPQFQFDTTKNNYHIWRPSASNIDPDTDWQTNDIKMLIESDNTVTISVNDTVTVAETVTMMVDLNPSISDSITVTESVAIDFPFEVSVFDAITVVESAAILIDLNPSVNDAITITENITTSNDLGDISVSDAITITEFAAFEFAPYEISVNDAISLTEYVQTEQESFVSVTEAITVTESVSQPMFSDPVRGVVHMRSQQQLYPLPMDNSEIL